MTLSERAEKAVALKNSGQYNCSQAVTAALADQAGLSEEQLKQISAGFCAGMGNMETTCGALKCKDLKAVTNGKPLCPCEDCVRNAVMIYGEVMGL